MNRVMPDLDKVVFISSVKVWFHAFCMSHFMLKKPSKILLAPVENGCGAFYSLNRSTFARPKKNYVTCMSFYTFAAVSFDTKKICVCL